MKPLAYYLDPVERERRIVGDEPHGSANLTIKWQEGPIDEAGVNGVLPEDVLHVALARINELNVGDFRCRTNSLAATAVEDAINWLLKRRIDRADAGTLGTSTP